MVYISKPDLGNLNRKFRFHSLVWYFSFLGREPKKKKSQTFLETFYSEGNHEYYLVFPTTNFTYVPWNTGGLKAVAMFNVSQKVACVAKYKQTNNCW